ncbi:MAG TPA: hypothetical protein V6C81_24735 [Planktothrix sp.]
MGGIGADSGLLCQIMAGRLEVTHQYPEDSSSNLKGTVLSGKDSLPIVLEFIAPDLDGSTIDAVELDSDSTADWGCLGNLLGGFKSSLLVPFRPAGIFLGFVAVQSVKGRTQSEFEVETVKSFGALAATLLIAKFELLKCSSSLADSKTELKLRQLFEEPGEPIEVVSVKAVQLIAEMLGFKNSRLLLVRGKDMILIDQSNQKPLDQKNPNPYARAFKTGLSAVYEGGCGVTHFDKCDQIAAEYLGDVGLVVPLREDEESEPIGVLGMWTLSPERRAFIDQYPEVASRFANQLAGLMKIRSRCNVSP